LFVVLEGFKQVNDTHGHHVGDQVIRGAGLSLAEWNDDNAGGVVGRLGGDEFAACFPATGPDRARLALGGLFGLLTAPLWCGGPTVAVGASIGACWSPEPAVHGLSELLRRADEAMYQAKNAGGGVLVTDRTRPAVPTVNGRRVGRPGAAPGGAR
jgi:diguanylate cyclase (GGDEF)-like protein